MVFNEENIFTRALAMSFVITNIWEPDMVIGAFVNVFASVMVTGPHETLKK